jgi:hypothetical protein
MYEEATARFGNGGLGEKFLKLTSNQSRSGDVTGAVASASYPNR